MMNRDNQQETATALEIGWLSGILEGEGSICLQVNRRKDRTQVLRVTPKVIITNSDKLLIEKCVEILTKLGIGKYVMHTAPNNGSFTNSTKDMTYIHISGLKRVKKLLETLKSCLYGEKQHRLNRLLKFINRRLEKSDSTGKKTNFYYDEEDVKNIMHFLELTRSKNISSISRLLNDYTQKQQTVA